MSGPLDGGRVLIVFVTGPGPDELARIGRTLVEERLAACMNIIPAIRSIYRWEGEVEDATEALAAIKTTEDSLEAMTRRVVELHPYDVPEVIAFPITGGHPAYLDWVRDVVGEAPTPDPGSRPDTT